MTIAEWITAISGKIAEIKSQIPFLYNAGIEEGREAERSDFWDKHQDYGDRTNYRYAFYQWREDNYFPQHDFVLKGQFGNMFQYTQIKSTKKLMDCQYKGTVSSVFANTSTLEKITLLKVYDYTVFTNWFTGTTGLKNITFTDDSVISNDISFESCTLLEMASIENIVETLSETVSGKTLTLSKTAVNTAFGIDVDNETTYPEGSLYYNLRHSRDNWSFNYI